VPHVASVAGRPIPLSRLEERVVQLRRGPRGRHVPPDGGAESLTFRRWIVQELVSDEVLAHEARAAGITHDTEGSSRVRGITPAALDELFALVTADVSVDEDDAHAYYERNRDLYRRPERRRVRHVLVADERPAIDVRARLDAGDDIADLARRLSTDRGTRGAGGDLGFVRRGELCGELEEAIFAASDGDAVGPVHTEHGWHVARVVAVAGETVAPFADVRDGIEAELLLDARSRAFGEWLAQRRSELAVVEPAYEHPGHPIHGTVRHRH
jgi:hypothetical protein